VTAVIYSPQIDDVDRLARFLIDSDPDTAASTAALINDALEILGKHPLIGRRVDAGMHELIISRGRTGYIALYEYDEKRDRATVHGIRHQREAGFEE
jgi:plasmid stabilization system protein ParE